MTNRELRQVLLEFPQDEECHIGLECGAHDISIIYSDGNETTIASEIDMGLSGVKMFIPLDKREDKHDSQIEEDMRNLPPER